MVAMDDTRTPPGGSTALLLIDLQRWIVDLPLSPIPGPMVVDRCARLSRAFVAAAQPVILVRYLRGDGTDGGGQAVSNRFVPEIATVAGALVVTKTGLDAFAGATEDGTPLGGLLAGLDVGTVVIAGIATPHGVAATALGALRHGYPAVVVPDATAASGSREHAAALASLRAASVEPAGVEEVIGRLRGRGIGLQQPARPSPR